MKMTRRDKNTTANQNGFTLVEVLVVLCILAIMALFVVPALSGYIDRSTESTAMAGCRSSVLAAQSLVSENYASGAGAPSNSEIKALADVKGAVSDLQLDAGNAKVLHLTYTEDDTIVTYCLDPDSCDNHDEKYTFSAPPEYEPWVAGGEYIPGESMVTAVDEYLGKALVFLYYSSTTSTSSPVNDKAHWHVVKSADGTPVPYASWHLYNVGAIVVTNSNGKLWVRTTYDPNASPTPFEGSKYWDLYNP